MVQRRGLRPLAAVLLVVALVSGCSLAGSSGSSGDSGVRMGWTSTDVLLPAAARHMDRIGATGPERIRTDEPVVINFWASTCGPCKKEMPLLQRLSRTGVAVIGVSRDNRLAFARQEIRDRKVTFPNYSDAAADVMFGLHEVLYPNGIPTTIIVRAGRVRWVHVGAFTSYSELHREIVSRLTAIP